MIAAMLDPTITPIILDAIERYRLATGKEPGQIRILDFGCGRGRSVARLRQLGYQAFGVDIEATEVEIARDVLRREGFDGAALVHTPDANGHAPFPDASFEFIFSEEVFEHVEHLDQAVAEIRRLTALDGAGLHEFPARLRPVETHYKLPFVHWLPKHPMRRPVIRLCHALGMPRRGLVEDIYAFSIHHTYYRSHTEVADAFGRYGFRTGYLTPRYEGLRRRGVPAPFLRGPLVRWLSLRFQAVYLAIRYQQATRSLPQVPATPPVPHACSWCTRAAEDAKRTRALIAGDG
jgi:SAM-dependent methyltransferase